jgi:NAD(P)H-flavin reductase
VPPRVAHVRAEVVAVRRLAPEIVEAELRMVEPPEFHFEAGQWVSVPFGPKRVRAYTMASTPQHRREITLCADVAPGGIGSEWFQALEPGQMVVFKGPTGGFVFDRRDPRRPLFVAEEIGIVPIRSILWDLYETGFGRPARLVHWARDPSWLVYERDFRFLARRAPSLEYVPVVREPAGGWPGDKGEAPDLVNRTVASVEGLVAYVSGGGVMINQVRRVLMGKGMDRKAVKWEKFW